MIKFSLQQTCDIKKSVNERYVFLALSEQSDGLAPPKRTYVAKITLLMHSLTVLLNDYVCKHVNKNINLNRFFRNFNAVQVEKFYNVL